MSSPLTPTRHKRFVRTSASLLSLPTVTACCRLRFAATFPTVAKKENYNFKYKHTSLYRVIWVHESYVEWTDNQTSWISTAEIQSLTTSNSNILSFLWFKVHLLALKKLKSLNWNSKSQTPGYIRPHLKYSQWTEPLSHRRTRDTVLSHLIRNKTAWK